MNKIWTAKEIYHLMKIKRYDEVREEGGSIERAKRQSTLYAVKWTTLIWKRQFVKMRNLFNPERW